MKKSRNKGGSELAAQASRRIPSAPKRFPVTLDQFLKLMLPERIGRAVDRYYLFRKYLAYRLCNPRRPPMECHPVNDHRCVDWDWLHPEVARVPPDSYSCHGVPRLENGEPTKEFVDKYFTLWREKPIPDARSFSYHATGFREWYREGVAEELSLKRRDAVNKRWAAHRERQKPK